MDNLAIIETKELDMDLVHKLKKFRAPLPEIKLKQCLNMLKKYGKIDGLPGAVNVGLILDTFNNNVKKESERLFNSETNARNKYYAPLWKMAIQEQANSGRFRNNVTSDIKGTDIKSRKKSAFQL